jgi:hypothetical protein
MVRMEHPQNKLKDTAVKMLFNSARGCRLQVAIFCKVLLLQLHVSRDRATAVQEQGCMRYKVHGAECNGYHRYCIPVSTPAATYTEKRETSKQAQTCVNRHQHKKTAAASLRCAKMRALHTKPAASPLSLQLY